MGKEVLVKIIFDIDSTLANTDHRHHFLSETPKNWKAFFAAAVDDTPIIITVDIYRALYGVYTNSIEFWTGRPERFRVETRKWLQKHVGPSTKYCQLSMRGYEDQRDDYIIKMEFIDPDAPPDLIFEDRDRVVNAFRHLGYTVYQVAPGDF